MSCPRGRASPNAHTKLRLFADSAGFCQNPSCLNRLFVETENNNFHIAEMAHVFSASNKGPRADVALTPEQRGAYENLILLCANCHTAIDKAEEDFPDDLILEWKKTHTDKIESIFGVATCETRADAKALVEPLLRENKTIFEEYGPLGESRFNPESHISGHWISKLRSYILPNNRKILAMFDANEGLLSAEEKSTLERYRLHVNDLESKHIGDHEASGTEFPEAITELFKD